MVEGAKLHLESNAIPARDARRAQTNLVHTRPRAPTETEQELCLNVSYGGKGQQWPASGHGLWVQQTWVWHKPSWRRSPLTPPYSCQNLHRTGETDSWRAQTKSCVSQDPEQRSSEPKRDWPRLASECPSVSSRGMHQWRPAAGSGALSAGVHAWDLLKEITIIFITSTIVWSQVKQQGGNTALPINRKLDLRFIEHGLPIKPRPSFPLSQSLPSGRFHKPLILLHQRADRMKTTITEN